MKTLPLRELLRRPTVVKEITARGDSVHITDNGKALWVLMPDRSESPGHKADETERAAWIDDYFAELSTSPITDGPSLSDLILESRGDR